ncbi:YwgA family protein [Salipaludibacillus sp. LMS25]|uniref:YwgA family protein n=1 Tax=Salipaludibacillus sp. LMS25 TaxID=2924031 RepID=UPI0020D1662A|nr:YwgA family protein [Salipaludibacillus sp. LMS25]UTR16298.1 YwgA family protein [Salipaludibacillus sp. LMS25]
MLNEHAKLLALFQQTGEIVGRKKLQKMIYIAKKLGLPFYEKYQYHMYGPYSEELTLRIEEMSQLAFISEVKEQKAGYQQYRYTLAEAGAEFLTMAGEDFPDVSHMLKHLNEQSAKFLELVSTVLFFEELSKEDVTKKVFKLKAKQNYTEEDIAEAYRFIERLRGAVTASGAVGLSDDIQ